MEAHYKRLGGDAPYSLGLQFGQGVIVVAHQHHLARGEVDGGGEFVLFDDFQPVQCGFLADVRVVRIAGQDGVIVVGEDVEVVLPGLFLQVGDQFGVDAAFEDDFPVFGLDDLAAVV